MGTELVEGVWDGSQELGEWRHHLFSDGAALATHLGAGRDQGVRLWGVVCEGDNDKQTQAEGGGEDWEICFTKQY